MGKQHGEVSFTLQGNIIIATLVGSFNEVGAQKYTEGLKDYINGLGKEAFAILVDNSLMNGGTPEAYQVLEKYNQWLNTINMIAKAIVVQNSVTNDLIEFLSPSIKLQTVKSFNEKSAALVWLQEKLEARFKDNF
jgi:hypothetical protein